MGGVALGLNCTLMALEGGGEARETGKRPAAALLMRGRGGAGGRGRANRRALSVSD
jgi:hypothetical protein